MNLSVQIGKLTLQNPVTVASGSYSQAYRITADTGLIYPSP